MRHKKRDFRIAFPWILIVFVFFLSFNVAFAHEENSLAESEAPDKISVTKLDEELEKREASGNTTSTDRVEYVDANGNPIPGAPTRIEFGDIKDHQELQIPDKHYDFKSAKVNDKECVYIGKYNDVIYYSTDGVIAVKLEEGQKLTMTYQEYYYVTIREELPEKCEPGKIVQKNGSLDVPLDISKKIRVEAGKDWIISVTPGKDSTVLSKPADTKKRFKIASVETDKGGAITRTAGDEYGATYKVGIKQDDTVVITYTDEGVYRVTINTKDNAGNEYINIEHSTAKGWVYLEGQDKLIWTYTKSNYGLEGYAIEMPKFHTKRGYRIVHMVMNGATLLTDGVSSQMEVPLEPGTTLATSTGGAVVKTEMVEQYTTNRGDEKDCSYEYGIVLENRVGSKVGEWKDYNFNIAPYDLSKQTLTVRLSTDGRRSGRGIDAVMWDPDAKKLVPVKDNDALEMSPVGEGILTLKKRRVRIFFAKAKPGYYSITAQYAHPHGKDTTTGSESNAACGNISTMDADSLGKDRRYYVYNDTWEEAKTAASAAGYTVFVAYAGVKITGDESRELFGALFSDYSEDLYVHYNSGAGMGVLPGNAVVKNIPDNPETNKSGIPMHSYGKNPDTNEGTRGMGTTFVMGEDWPEPTCEGYEFIGWKLKNRSGKLSDEIYSHGDLFTISEANYGFANNTNLPLCSWTNKTGYQIVAQWKKKDIRKVTVNHWLKKPDGTENVEKKTAGTVTFAKDNETLIIIGKPEPDGTFPGYIFDNDDKRNTLTKAVANDSSTGPIELNLYYKPTSLTVSKVVPKEDYDVSPERDFNFTIKATTPDGTPAEKSKIYDGQVYIRKGTEGSWGSLTFTDNKATFKLKKGESVEMGCLPNGWTYTVTEDAPGNNYTAHYKIDGGVEKDGYAAEFTMKNGIGKIEFINRSTIAHPETGISFNSGAWTLMLMMALLICIGGITYFRKYKK